jgi:negative regulator of flagellin synthesis FlgM
MKIGPIENKAALPAAVAERKPGQAAANAGSAEPSAKVELSAGALMGAAGTESVFDAEKVKRITDAIRDGKFEINAEAIADKLIANAHELLTPRSSN